LQEAMTQIFYNCGPDALAAAVKPAISRAGTSLEHDRHGGEENQQADASDRLLKPEGHKDHPRALPG
jgi:hypothetical protein